MRFDTMGSSLVTYVRGMCHLKPMVALMGAMGSAVRSVFLFCRPARAGAAVVLAAVAFTSTNSNGCHKEGGGGVTQHATGKPESHSTNQEDGGGAQHIPRR